MMSLICLSTVLLILVWIALKISSNFDRYLSNEKQQVMVNGQCCMRGDTISAGVPQGLVHGMLLFFIDMNDQLNMKCNINLLLMSWLRHLGMKM